MLNQSPLTLCLPLLQIPGSCESDTETPVVACIVSGFLAALLSLLVSLRDLIEMMSIGTLLAAPWSPVCVPAASIPARE